MSADPGRLDSPVGPPVAADWVSRSGTSYTGRYHDSVPFGRSNAYIFVGNTYPTMDPGRLVSNNQGDNRYVWLMSVYQSAAGIGNFIPWIDGGQVRHCIKGNRLYRFASHVESSRRKWVFDDIDMIGEEHIVRPVLETPPNTFQSSTDSNYWRHADTRFVPTPHGVIAVHGNAASCSVSYWAEGRDTWTDWSFVYGAQPTTQDTIPRPYVPATQWGCVKSSPGEYVDIVAVRRIRISGSLYENRVTYHRWSAGDLPLQPTMNLSSGDVINATSSETVSYTHLTLPTIYSV